MCGSGLNKRRPSGHDEKTGSRHERGRRGMKKQIRRYRFPFIPFLFPARGNYQNLPCPLSLHHERGNATEDQPGSADSAGCSRLLPLVSPSLFHNHRWGSCGDRNSLIGHPSLSHSIGRYISLSSTLNISSTLFFSQIQGAFTSHANPKYFLFHPLHQIFERMHVVLNVGKKITNCIVWL
jgi:hypothetical protein